MTTALPDHLADDHDLKKFVELTAEADRYLDYLVENDPAAIAELRRLILEGLESIEEANEEADDDWLESLVEGVRQRAAARSAERK